MQSPFVYIKDASLDNEIFNDLHLSIQLKLDGFSFCIINKELKKRVGLVAYSFSRIKNPMQLLSGIQEVYEHEPLLAKTFTSVNVSHVGEVVTPVPQEFFAEAHAEGILGFNQRLLDKEIVVYDELDQRGLNMVYAPLVEINDYLYDLYGPFNYKHSCSVFLERVQVPEQGDFSVINCYRKVFEMAVFKNGKLQLLNVFPFHTPKDLVYYVLFVYEQLKLSTEEVPLEIYGAMDKDSMSYELLYDFIRHIQLGKRNTDLDYSSEFDALAPHKFFTLLNQY